MDYQKICAALEKAGVVIKKNGFFRQGTKQKADEAAAAVLRLHEVTADEVLEEFRKAEKAKLAKLYSESDSEGSLDDEYKYVVIKHKLLEDVDAVGSPDMLVFKKIRYASNPVDNSIIILVNTHGASWKAIALSGSGNTDRIQLVAACSKAEAIHSDLFSNYYEEIVAYTTKPLRDIFSQYRRKVIKDKTLLVTTILEKVPHTLLQNASVKALCKRKKVTLGEDHEEVQWIPQTAGLYVSPESSEKYDTFGHLVKKAYTLAAIPEFQCAMPAIISNRKDEPSLHYIDLDTIAVVGDTPTWDEFAERFTPDDFKVLMAFIWSLLDASNKGRQLLYIYDPDGFSGKSVLMSVLARFLGPDVSASLQKDSLNNQFSLAKIWDKRLITIDDNKNRLLIKSEKMHMILGGGWADIEMKGKNSFHAKLFAKVIAGGNVPLSIDPYAVHERSRLITIRTRMEERILKRFCQVDKEGHLVLRNGKPIMLGDPSFEENLLKEFPAFLTKCREAYKELCPTHANIILNEEQVDALFNLADDNDYIFDRIVEEGFEIGEKFSMAPFEFQRVFYRTRDNLKFTLSKDIPSSISLADFKEYLSKRYPFYRPSRSHSGLNRASERVYIGIKEKEQKGVLNAWTR